MGAKVLMLSFVVGGALLFSGPTLFPVALAQVSSPVSSPSPSSSVVPSPTATTTPSVLDGNRAPIADAGSDLLVEPAARVLLDGRGSADVDGDELLYQWEQIDGPVQQLEQAQTATPAFSAGQPGETYIFSLTVRDPQGASAFDTVTVTTQGVSASAPPPAGVPTVETTELPLEESGVRRGAYQFLFERLGRWLNGVLLSLVIASTGLSFLDRSFRVFFNPARRGHHRLTSLLFRKGEAPQGQVVHYQTGEGIAGAQVLVYDTDGKLRSREVTNESGDFSTFFPPGEYTIEVKAEGFSFASGAARSSWPETGILYTGGVLSIDAQSPPPVVVIPMKPAAAGVGSLRTLSLRFWQALQQLGRTASWPLFAAGAAVNTGLLFFMPSGSLLLFEVLYVVLVILKIALELRVRPAYGIVRDTITHTPLDLVVVRLLDAQTNRLVMTRITDAQGRFFALPPPGQYTVIMTKPGYAPFSQSPVEVSDEHDSVLRMAADMMPIAPPRATAAIA